MGEQTDRKLYFSVNGVVYTEIIEFQTVTPEAAESELPLNGGCFTARIKMPKVLRCKSRKRFAKLLMSIGVPRNAAHNVTAKPGQSYSSLWWYVAMTQLCCCQRNDV